MKWAKQISMFLIILVGLFLVTKFVLLNRLAVHSYNSDLPAFNNIRWLISENEVALSNNKLLLPLEPNRIVDPTSNIWKSFKVREYHNMLFLNRTIDVGFIFLNDQLISYKININHVDSMDIFRCDSDFVSFLRLKFGYPHIYNFNPPRTFCVWDTNNIQVYYTSKETRVQVDRMIEPAYVTVSLFSAQVLISSKPFDDILKTLGFQYFPRNSRN
jgi:hypothetical protein